MVTTPRAALPRLFEETYGKPTTVALNKASKAYLATANGGVLSPRGLLLVARAEEADSFATDLATMALTQIGVADAQAMVPILNPDVIAQAAYDARGMGYRHRPPDPEFRPRGPRAMAARC